MSLSSSDQSTQVAADLTQPATLVRALGARIAIAVVVGSVIGSGIFLKPGNIAAEAGSFPLIISVWVFGGVLCILGALCFAELATMLPHAGGLYVYLREAYGRPVAFLFGWCEFLFAKPASNGALAVMWAYNGWHGITPLFLAIYTWFMIQVYLSKPLESRTGLLLIALGLPVYFTYRNWSAIRQTNEIA